MSVKLYNITDKQNMKKDIYQKKIEKIIDRYSAGYAFSSADFIDISNIDAINKALSRLCESGVIRRIIHGIYDKPIYSRSLSSYSSPDINSVALALARKYNWTIAPAEETALNILHISTQVSNKWCYISDGPYRKYKIGKFTLEFKHCANKEISGKSNKTITIIQALKYIGKDHIQSKDLKIISSGLTAKEKRILLEESKTTTIWIYNLVKEINNL